MLPGGGDSLHSRPDLSDQVRTAPAFTWVSSPLIAPPPAFPILVVHALNYSAVCGACKARRALISHPVRPSPRPPRLPRPSPCVLERLLLVRVILALPASRFAGRWCPFAVTLRGRLTASALAASPAARLSDPLADGTGDCGWWWPLGPLCGAHGARAWRPRARARQGTHAVPATWTSAHFRIECAHGRKLDQGDERHQRRSHAHADRQGHPRQHGHCSLNYFTNYYLLFTHLTSFFAILRSLRARVRRTCRRTWPRCSCTTRPLPVCPCALLARVAFA